MTNPRVFKVSDGNGGHFWDWIKIKETVIGGLILAMVISIGTTILNRYFNFAEVLATMNQIKSYQLRSLQMNNAQNSRINENTKLIWNKWYPGVPPPQICWPETEEKHEPIR